MKTPRDGGVFFSLYNSFMKKIILIKFGGSLISDRNKVNVARAEVIGRLSEQVKRIVEEKKDLSLILATGAGGFGHPLAEKYKDNLRKGWPQIRASVRKLNKIVTSSLRNLHVPAKSVSPFFISQPKTKALIELLKEGKVPVFHADLLKGGRGKILILSMDKFLVDVALELKRKGFVVDKVIFCGITDGVLNSRGATIKTFREKSALRLGGHFFQTGIIDVSGGMKQKVKECLRLVDKKITALIINGQKKDSLYQAIVNNKIEGTVIGESAA